MNVEATLKAAVIELRDAGIREATLDARLLLAYALESTTELLFAYPERGLTEDQTKTFMQLLERRLKREPMAHIMGEREFWSLRFVVGPETLIPRPDSETLVDAFLDAFPNTQDRLKILDLGTGSGCLLLAALSERQNATGLGLDISLTALEFSRRNAHELGMASRARFLQADWKQDLSKCLEGNRYDAIFCNPPYIPVGHKTELEPEVAEYEPHQALFAGVDGLDCYRDIIPQIPRILAPGGCAFFETGFDQAESVEELLHASGHTKTRKHKDLAGVDRVISCYP